MLWYWIIGTMAAFGVFSALWALLGWLLPNGRGCALVCWGIPDEGILARWKWLRGMGVLDVPLLAVTEEKTASLQTEICSREELLARLEWERNRVNGTGTGDSSGRGQCRGISEL